MCRQLNNYDLLTLKLVDQIYQVKRDNRTRVGRRALQTNMLSESIALPTLCEFPVMRHEHGLFVVCVDRQIIIGRRSKSGVRCSPAFMASLVNDPLNTRIDIVVEHEAQRAGPTPAPSVLLVGQP